MSQKHSLLQSVICPTSADGGHGTLKAWAEELGLDDAAELLQETLDEEEATDEALTEIAKSAINQQAEAA